MIDILSMKITIISCNMHRTICTTQIELDMPVCLIAFLNTVSLIFTCHPDLSRENSFAVLKSILL